jgi:hypothetical protein
LGVSSEHSLSISPLTQIKAEEKIMSDCGCGRSPTGKCVGWHNLTEEEYLEKKAAWEKRQAEKDAK